MIDIKKLNEAIGSSGWMLEGTEIDTDGFNSRLTIRLYGNRQKQEDPKAWREENLAKQAAGVKFQNRCGYFWQEGNWNFEGNKEDYREVPQEDLNLKPTGDRWYEMQIEQPAIGVISSFNKWDRVLTEKEISDLFSGKVRPEDIPQEAPKVKEIDARIPGASRRILRSWHGEGVVFMHDDLVGSLEDPHFSDKAGVHKYFIPEQPIPDGTSVETVEAMWRQGLKVIASCDNTEEICSKFNWFDGTYKGAELLKRLRIPAQPIPEKLLEVSPPTPHAEERALWKAQREAGTNEVWQKRPKIRGIDWADIRHDLMFEPGWDPDWDYRVKPMKLTAKIISGGVCEIPYYWEFTGTREEYRAECEKYGYAILSEIKEVVEKPKTVKYYFALYKTSHGYVTSISGHTKDWVNEWITDNGHTIIGDIEERDV